MIITTVSKNQIHSRNTQRKPKSISKKQYNNNVWKSWFLNTGMMF